MSLFRRKSVSKRKSKKPNNSSLRYTRNLHNSTSRNITRAKNEIIDHIYRNRIVYIVGTAGTIIALGTGLLLNYLGVAELGKKMDNTNKNVQKNEMKIDKLENTTEDGFSKTNEKIDEVNNNVNYFLNSEKKGLEEEIGALEAENKNIDKEKNNLEYALLAKDYARERVDDKYFLSKEELGYLVNDLKENSKNSEYAPLINVLMRSGNFKTDSRFNSFEKMINMFSESLDGNLKNYEFNEVEVVNFPEEDGTEYASFGINKRCCGAKGRFYLTKIECKDGKEATIYEDPLFTIDTSKECIDDESDIQIVDKTIEKLIADYAIQNRELMEPVINKFMNKQEAYN